MSLLHFGDIISLYSDGFLSTLGLVDDRCVLQPAKYEGAGDTDKDPPKKFRDCLFKVCIQHNYTVQNELWHSGHLEEELYKKLYVAAREEQEKNLEKNQLHRGTVVKYEDIIQLLHIKSNKYITVNAKLAAHEERDATRVYLDANGNEGSYFKVKSPFKYRSNGEDVVCESIALVSEVLGQNQQDLALYLHASSLCLIDNPDCLEINASRASTSWEVKPFLDHTEDQNDFLKGGDVVRLFHTDQEKFLTMDTHDAADADTQHVFLRSTDRAKATSATSSKALWEVEVVHADPSRASLARWNSLIRLKHLATERFLAAELDDDPSPDPMREKLRQKGAPVYKLISIEFSYDYATLFEFESTTMNVNDTDFIPINSNISLKHHPTATYVHSTSIYIDKDKKKSCMSKVGCAHHRALDEVFAVIPVSATEIRDLDFVSDASLVLEEAYALIKEADEIARVDAHRKLAELLPEIIHFIANKESEPRKIEKALTMLAENPNRERQKLLREQNVLKILFDILDLEDKVDANRDVCRLCYRVLILSFQDYRKNQEYIVKWDKFMQSQFGKDISAETAYAALFHSNKNLLEKCVTTSDIQLFTDHIRKQRQSNLMDCLSELCITSKGSVSAQTQKLICQCILSEINSDILIETCINQANGQILLSTEHWTLIEGLKLDVRDEMKLKKPLRDIAMAAKNGYEVDAFILDYYRHQLDLFSSICVSNHAEAIDILSWKLSLKHIQYCISDGELPCELRASFCRLLLNLYLIVDTQSSSSPLSSIHNLKRDWLEVPKKITLGAFDAEHQLPMKEFDETITFVEHYLINLTDSQSRYPTIYFSIERNKLTYEVVNLIREFTYMRFYTLDDFLRLARLLLVLLEDDKNQQKLVMRTKTKIIEILQYIFEVRSDYIISCLLVVFKTEQNSPKDREPSIELVNKITHALNCHSKEVSFDERKGERLVSVLLHLVEHDCPELVTASLKLLLKYRSQRMKLLDSLKRIELLNAPGHVRDNFKKLNTLVAKSNTYIRKEPDLDYLAVNKVLLSNAKLISFIVRHIQFLIKNKENEESLTTDLLRLLKDLIPVEDSVGRQQASEKVALIKEKQPKQSFSRFRFKQPAMERKKSSDENISEIQNKLDSHGVSNLVVELIALGASGSDEKVRERAAAAFSDTINLGIALLHGGNPLIQASIHEKLTRKSELDKSEKFFEVLSNRMSQAQQALNPLTSQTADVAGPKATGAAMHASRMKRFNMAKRPASSMSFDLMTSPKFLRQLSMSTTGEALVMSESLRDDIVSTVDTTEKALAITRAQHSASHQYSQEEEFVNAVNNHSQQRCEQQQESEQKQKQKERENNGVELTDSGYSATPTPVDFGPAASSSADASTSSASTGPMVDEVPQVIRIMCPILRFLQLLCEDHNLVMQNYMHFQTENKTNHDLVSKTLVFLNCVCGSKEGSLGHKLGEYIKENNIELINQTLRTLTEYCQGPCIDNQSCILMHESNGIDMIRSLILSSIDPKDNLQPDLVLELKDNALKLLLALLESCSNPNHAARVLREPSNTDRLINVAIIYYHEQRSYEDVFAEVDEETHTPGGQDGTTKPLDVGHKVFILCHQIAQLYNMLPAPTSGGPAPTLVRIKTSDECDFQAAKAEPPAKEQFQRDAVALRYYESHTAQIEIVRANRQMDRVVFPVPRICEYLTPETKAHVYHNTEQDERGSKIPNFFQSIEALHEEMNWQRELQTQGLWHFIARHMSLWSSIEFQLTCLVTVLVLFCAGPAHTHAGQPLGSGNGRGGEPSGGGSLDEHGDLMARSMSTTMAMFFSTIFLFRIKVPHSLTLMLTGICLYMSLALGKCVTLRLLGLALEGVTTMHLFSVLINKGFINKPLAQMLREAEALFHGSYLLVCTLSMTFSPLFYPFLLPPSLIRREETLRNVIKSVTKNAYSILMTGFLGLIIILLYAIVSYLMLGEDFVVELADGTPYKPCLGSLGECFVALLNYGVRDGGGIGEHMSDTKLELSFRTELRLGIILSFFLVVNLMILQLVSCIILDSFATLRSEKQHKEETLRDNCFVCGLDRTSFENRSVTFEEHIQIEHNLWHYLYFIVSIKIKSRTELSGPESYVYDCIKNKDHSWFPRMRAMSLGSGFLCAAD